MNLDRRLWQSGYSVSERKNRFASINRRLKAVMQAEHQCVVRQPSRVNYSWEDMLSKWLNHAKKYPSRKNRIPLEKTRLSNWVHEQRKAYRLGELPEDQKEILGSNGFDFHPRKTKAMLSSQKRQMSKKGSASVDFKDDCMLEDEYEYTDEEPAPLSGNELDQKTNPDFENTNLHSTEHAEELSMDKQADQKTNPDLGTTNLQSTEHPEETIIDKQANPDCDTNQNSENTNFMTTQHQLELNTDKPVSAYQETNPDSENTNVPTVSSDWETNPDSVNTNELPVSADRETNPDSVNTNVLPVSADRETNPNSEKNQCPDGLIRLGNQSRFRKYQCTDGLSGSGNQSRFRRYQCTDK